MAACVGRLARCGGKRRLPTGAQDSILPHKTPRRTTSMAEEFRQRDLGIF